MNNTVYNRQECMQNDNNMKKLQYNIEFNYTYY